MNTVAYNTKIEITGKSKEDLIEAINFVSSIKLNYFYKKDNKLYFLNNHDDNRKEIIPISYSNSNIVAEMILEYIKSTNI